MITLKQVQHDIPTATIEVVGETETGERYCRNFSPLQCDELRAVAGAAIEPYIALAGWTPEFIAARKAEEERLAAEAEAKRTADEAAAREAEIQRQMAILAEAQARLAAQQP